MNRNGVVGVMLASLMVINKAVDEKHKAQSSDSNTKGNATHQTENMVSVSLLRMLSSTRLPSSVMLLPEQTQSMKRRIGKKQEARVLAQTIQVKSSECGVVLQRLCKFHCTIVINPTVCKSTINHLSFVFKAM